MELSHLFAWSDKSSTMESSMIEITLKRRNSLLTACLQPVWIPSQDLSSSILDWPGTYHFSPAWLLTRKSSTPFISKSLTLTYAPSTHNALTWPKRSLTPLLKFLLLLLTHHSSCLQLRSSTISSTCVTSQRSSRTLCKRSHLTTEEILSVSSECGPTNAWESSMIDLSSKRTENSSWASLRLVLRSSNKRKMPFLNNHSSIPLSYHLLKVTINHISLSEIYLNSSKCWRINSLNTTTKYPLWILCFSSKLWSTFAESPELSIFQSETLF